MNKLDKIHGLFLLFVLLVLVLVINPRIIKNIYNSFLGRIILIIIVLFFAMNSMTLGLLTALVFIIASNMVFREGAVGNMDSTISDTTQVADATVDTSTSTSTTIGTNNSSKDKDGEKTGVSVLSDSLVSQEDSAKLPVSLPGSSENVLPSEGFQSMYASF
jgi:uncharacterized protein YxeA